MTYDARMCEDYMDVMWWCVWRHHVIWWPMQSKWPWCNVVCWLFPCSSMVYATRFEGSSSLQIHLIWTHPYKRQSTHTNCKAQIMCGLSCIGDGFRLNGSAIDEEPWFDAAIYVEHFRLIKWCTIINIKMFKNDFLRMRWPMYNEMTYVIQFYDVMWRKINYLNFFTSFNFSSHKY